MALGKATPASDHEDAALPLRTRLAGRYEIVDVLGKGGMGAVYLALDEALGGKPIALKLVTRELAEGEALEELRREVVLAQQVTHRNVCRIYDLEQLDGRWMIKMECVSGETLSARIERVGRIAVGEAIGIARQIAAGLGAAHDQGVIHRDLKPGNVMIEEKTGRVVLMDFGIARAAGTDAATDRAGTPSYMAPEQARGERIDERADVYALGCVLFAMLTGEKAFPDEPRDDAAPPDPRAKRPDVPAWLARAVLAMLARDPRKRPANAADVLRILTGAERRRAWLLVGAAAVAIVVGAFAIALATRSTPKPREPWHAAIREIEPGYDENADSVAWSPDGRKLAFSSDRERPGWLRGRVRDLARDADDTAVTPPEMNILMIGWTRDGESLLFTDLASGMKAYRMPATGGAPELIGDGYAIDCGGKLLRFEFGSPPRFILRDPSGSEREVLRLDSSAFVTTYRCDRRGTRVVWSRAELGAPFYQPADLWIADLATGTPRRLTDDGKRNCYPTFTPDGHAIVFTSARGGGVMNLWELPLDGRPARQLTFGNGNDLLADVSPDGAQVVFTVDVTSAPLFAYPGRTRLTPSRVILIDPQVSPDGTAIVAADYAPLTPRIVAVSIADGAVRALGDGVTSAITVDGRDVVFASDGAPSTISVVPFGGGTPRAVGALDGLVRALRAGPDGTIHAMLDRGSAVEAWALRLDGGEPRREADAPWCFVQPAPAGGWSLWMRCAPIEGVLVPPGETPAADAPGIRMRGPMFFGGDFDATGTTFVAYDQPTVLRVDVATGAATPVFDAGLYGATVSPDGRTIYTTEAVGSARRNLITNFASRPR